MGRCDLPLGLYLHLILIWTLWNEVKGGKDFLIAIHSKSYTRQSRIKTTTKTGGVMQVQYPCYQYKESFQVENAFSHYIGKNMGTTKGVESKSILFTTSNHAIEVYVDSDFFLYNIFSPLPLSALGQKYIVSSCDSSGPYRPFLVIATHKEKTDVEITFKMTSSISYDGRTYRDRDTLRLTLGAYQTFTIESWSDFSGTIVISSQTIALFTGLLNTTFVVAYDQLLPVKHYSTEYVVAVDDKKYSLQLISETNTTRITFTNGSSVTVNENGLCHRTLQQNELFHFTTNNPVMTTLCRLNGDRSGFCVVPPVSNYTTQTNIYIHKTDTRAMLLTSKNTDRNFSPSRVSRIWKHIPNSQYMVGEFRTTNSLRARSDTTFTGAILFYKNYSIYSYGLSAENATTGFTETSDMSSYILAVPTYAHTYVAAVGETGGFWQVQYPHRKEVFSRESLSYTADYVYIDYKMIIEGGIENKAILVNAKSTDLHITLYSKHSIQGIISFSPLPLSVLGTKYIISSCYNPSGNTSLMIIATASETANISITFRLKNQNLNYDGKTYHDGETLNVVLHEYQTFTIPSPVSLCGTTVIANRKVAVFVKANFARSDVSIHQILPVTLYGQEYVAAVGQQFSSDSIQYHLLVIGEHNDTQITFNNGESATIGERNFYLKHLKMNESFVFTTTLPVMSSLCMFSNQLRLSIFDSPLYSCSVLPAITQYTYSTGILLPGGNVIKILTEKTAHDLNVKRSTGRYWTETVSVNWSDIPNTNYKVGTCRLSTFATSTVFVNANNKFTILGYGSQTSQQIILTEGYNFHKTGIKTTTEATGGQQTYLSTSESSILDTRLVSRSDSSTRQHSTRQSTTALFSHVTNPTEKENAAQTLTTLVGITCGFVILVLIIVIVGFVINIRNFDSKGLKAERRRGAPRSNRERSSPNQETSFTADAAPAVANVAVISDNNTYSNLFSEDQCESAYEQISKNNPQHMNMERR